MSLAVLKPTRKIQAQVVDLVELFPRAPALDERFLGRVLGVFAIAEHEQQGADQLVAAF